jgi:hypothetical protein
MVDRRVRCFAISYVPDRLKGYGQICAEGDIGRETQKILSISKRLLRLHCLKEDILLWMRLPREGIKRVYWMS